MIRYVILILILLLHLGAYGQSTSVENWSQDIDSYKAGLEKHHIDLYSKINKAEFEQELQRIKASLYKKSDLEIIIDLMRLTRKIGDGHTAVSLRSIDYSLFPIEVYKMNGKWRVVKTTNEHKSLLGKSLIGIDGNSIEAITKQVIEVAQYVEN